MQANAEWQLAATGLGNVLLTSSKSLSVCRQGEELERSHRELTLWEIYSACT
jgi:hypothetical protein